MTLRNAIESNELPSVADTEAVEYFLGGIRR